MEGQGDRKQVACHSFPWQGICALARAAANGVGASVRSCVLPSRDVTELVG